MTTEERLDRIEGLMESVAERHVALEDAQINLARVHAKLEESLTSFINETKDRIGNLTVIVDGIAQTQNRTDRELEKLTQTVSRVSEAQEQTEYKLNALIDTVDRIVRSRND